MKRRLRLWPRTLFARLTLIWILALMAGHLLNSAWLAYAEIRDQRVMAGNYLGQDVSNLVAILERVPPAERALWVERLQRVNYRYRLGANAESQPDQSVFGADVASKIQRQLGPGYRLTANLPQTPDMDLALRLQLRDGTPLSIEVSRYKEAASPWGGLIMAVQLLTLGLFTWLAVRQATRPLQQLAQTADQLGASLAAAPLPEDGPLEVARAAVAFNAMQKRIAAHMEERMQILAAISHDLQTPITRMRLRADLLDSSEQRDKLHGDLDAMQALVEEGIAYARSAHGSSEPPCRIDLDALLDSAVCDYADAGQPISLQGQFGRAINARPLALRRILANLIDNALKYGGCAQIEVSAVAANQVAIAIRDRGPGIPPEELQAVLQPFYRLEASRNRHTGGTGLGLAIAHQLALASGGQLHLSNLDGGGLQAQLLLPVAA